MTGPVKKVIFPVAGLGSQTDGGHVPYSELRTVLEKPIIQFAIDECRASGIEQFIFVTYDERSHLESHLNAGWHRNANQVDTAEQAHLSSGEAIFVSQPERKGIGDAVRQAAELVAGEAFAVVIPNLIVVGDRPCLGDLVDAFDGQSAVIGVSPVAEEAIGRYGIAKFENDQLVGIVEKPDASDAPSNQAAFGRWVFPPDFLEWMLEMDANADGDITITDAVNLYATKGTLTACPIVGDCFDVRDQKGLVRASLAAALNNPNTAEIVSESERDFRWAGVSTLRSAAWSNLYGDLHPLAVLAQVIHKDFIGKVALVSSFGGDSVVLLHMVSRIDQDLPVLFLDTQKHFPETYEYVRQVQELLGLRNVTMVQPDPRDLSIMDAAGDLHRQDSNRCCHIRKTLPMERALAPFDCWITGRKRFQNDTRSVLPLFEEDRGGRMKVNPLIDWGRSELNAYFDQHDLPRHPLWEQGYRSIGCAPCTSPVKEGEDERAGRWRDSGKTECGIHMVDGKLVRVRAET